MSSYYNLIITSLPILLQGAWTTLSILTLSAAVSISVGLSLGVLISERIRIPGISSMFELGCFVLRAVPFYVQLLIMYFVLPDLLGINFDTFTASTIALGLCSSAYTAQLVRCGINSIARAQWEIATVLGYSTIGTLRHIIFPQMIRNVLPAFVNEIESLLKSTSILSSIGMLELTRVGMNIVSREMEPLAIYLTLALFYVVISAVLNVGAKSLEKRLRYAYSY